MPGGDVRDEARPALDLVPRRRPGARRCLRARSPFGRRRDAHRPRARPHRHPARAASHRRGRWARGGRRHGPRRAACGRRGEAGRADASTGWSRATVATPSATPSRRAEGAAPAARPRPTALGGRVRPVDAGRGRRRPAARRAGGWADGRDGRPTRAARSRRGRARRPGTTARGTRPGRGYAVGLSRRARSPAGMKLARGRCRASRPLALAAAPAHGGALRRRRSRPASDARTPSPRRGSPRRVGTVRRASRALRALVVDGARALAACARSRASPGSSAWTRRGGSPSRRADPLVPRSGISSRCAPSTPGRSRRRSPGRSSP